MSPERQRTLVAWYGVKPPPVEGLIHLCQDVLSREFNDAFRGYQSAQIHATVIGLEHDPQLEMCNRNFHVLRGRAEQINVRGFIRFLRTSAFFPMSIQLGGFQNRDYPFVSRSQRPYLRSFSIQGDKAVLLGWPVLGRPVAENPGRVEVFDAIRESRQYPMTLDELRRCAQNFGILHQYHKNIVDTDNDFYLRLGTFSTPLGRTAIEQVEGALREILGNREPTVVNVEQSDLSIVAYDSESLPVESSSAFRLTDTKIC